MKAATNSRRDRVRAMLADLKMPGALEAVDGILAQADSGSATATEAIEELLKAQIGATRRPRLGAEIGSHLVEQLRVCVQPRRRPFQFLGDGTGR